MSRLCTYNGKKDSGKCIFVEGVRWYTTRSRRVPKCDIISRCPAASVTENNQSTNKKTIFIVCVAVAALVVILLLLKELVKDCGRACWIRLRRPTEAQQERLEEEDAEREQALTAPEILSKETSAATPSKREEVKVEAEISPPIAEKEDTEPEKSKKTSDESKETSEKSKETLDESKETSDNS